MAIISFGSNPIRVFKDFRLGKSVLFLCSKVKISKIYQFTRKCSNDDVTIGDPINPQFEPTLAWLENLRQVYQESK